MASLLRLNDYISSSGEDDSETDEKTEDFTAHLQPVSKSNRISSTIALNAAPVVVSNVRHHHDHHHHDDDHVCYHYNHNHLLFYNDL